MHETTASYSFSIEPDHRKKHGQFFTEKRVARFMVNWVLQGNSSTLYDPAFGLGAFYYAARENGFKGNFFGSEIDAKILSHFRLMGNTERCSIELLDYLSQWGQCHDAIICNPPYMRFQKFEGRERAFQNFNAVLGIKLSGYTNISSAFLIKSISELSPQGRLAYIMPLEFLNTGYGAVVKKFLLEQGSIKAIVKIECEKDVFPDATTSVGIILFEKLHSNSPVNFYLARTVENLDSLLDCPPVRSLGRDELQPDEKWLRYFEPCLQDVDSRNLVPISTYGTFSRGIATGANEYFTLSINKASQIGLRSDEFVPCITKSAQIKSPIFTHRHLDSLINGEAPVLLLNIQGSPSSGAKEYLMEGEKVGYQRRYLTRTRNPWYRLENRVPSPLLFGVFSRGGFKVIRNHTNALNLTCFHGFSPNILGDRYIDHLFIYFLSGAGRAIISLRMRRYGGALDKFEPNDLNKAMCPSVEWLDQISLLDVQKELVYINNFGELSSRGEAMFSGLIKSPPGKVIQTDQKKLRSCLPLNSGIGNGPHNRC